MALATTAWAEAVRLYWARAVPAKDLAARTGLSTQAFVAKARKERAQAGEEGPSVSEPVRQPSSDPKTQRKRPPKPEALVKRVYNAIDAELSKLEAHKGAGTAQDRERASRALAQMVTSLEKAIDMQRQMAKDEGKAPRAKDKEALAHAEDLRREIAERLERLRLKRRVGGRAA